MSNHNQKNEKIISRSIDGKITLGCLIETLVELEDYVFDELEINTNANMKNTKDHKLSLSRVEGASNAYIVQMRKGSIYSGDGKKINIKKYNDVCRNSIDKFKEIRNRYVKAAPKDYQLDAEPNLLDRFLQILNTRGVNTDRYERVFQDDGFDKTCDLISEDVSQYICNLYKVGTVAEKEITRREFPIRVLLNYDDDNVKRNIKNVVEKIQQDHANPISIHSEFEKQKANCYDFYYMIYNYVIPSNAINIIDSLPKMNGYPVIRLFVRDEYAISDDNIRKLCKERNIIIKTFNDDNVYKYDIYADLREIIDERDRNISEYITIRSKSIEEKLSRENAAEEIDSIDFMRLTKPLSLFDKKSKYYRLFVDEYISEKRGIAKIVSFDQARDIYDELVELASNHGIQMDINLEYAKFLKDNKKDNSKAIECLERYKAFCDFQGWNIDNKHEIYMLLGDFYLEARELDKAEGYLCKAQGLIPEDNKEELVKTITLRANCLWLAGRYTDAEQLVDEKIQFIESCYIEAPEVYRAYMSKILKTKGNILHGKRELEEARNYLIRSLKVGLNCDALDNDAFDINRIDISDYNSDEQTEIAATSNNLGILNRRRVAYKESCDYYDFGIRIRKEIYEQNKRTKNEDNKNIDKYIRKYGLIISNKADMLWQIADEDVSPLKISRLMEEAIHIKEETEDKANKRNIMSMFFSYIQYARFYICMREWEGAEEKLKKAEDYINRLEGQQDDNTYRRHKASLLYEKARFELESLKEGMVLSDRCGEILENSYSINLKLANKNEGFYLEELVDTGFELLKYYKLKGNKEKADVEIVYGTVRAAAGNLAKKHSIYERKVKMLEELLASDKEKCRELRINQYRWIENQKARKNNTNLII